MTHAFYIDHPTPPTAEYVIIVSWSLTITVYGWEIVLESETTSKNELILDTF